MIGRHAQELWLTVCGSSGSDHLSACFLRFFPIRVFYLSSDWQISSDSWTHLRYRCKSEVWKINWCDKQEQTIFISYEKLKRILFSLWSIYLKFVTKLNYYFVCVFSHYIIIIIVTICRYYLDLLKCQIWRSQLENWLSLGRCQILNGPFLWGFTCLLKWIEIVIS